MNILLVTTIMAQAQDRIHRIGSDALVTTQNIKKSLSTEAAHEVRKHDRIRSHGGES